MKAETLASFGDSNRFQEVMMLEKQAGNRRGTEVPLPPLVSLGLTIAEAAIATAVFSIFFSSNPALLTNSAQRPQANPVTQTAQRIPVTHSHQPAPDGKGEPESRTRPGI